MAGIEGTGLVAGGIFVVDGRCRCRGLHCAAMTREPLDVSVVGRANDNRGFLAHLAVGPDRVIGVGGTRGPLVTLSSTGRKFVEGASTESGLRCTTFGPGWVAAVGEYGTFAVTRNVDALADPTAVGWTEVETGIQGCLYCVHRGPDGVLWIMGDDGFLARVIGSDGQEIDQWLVDPVTIGYGGRVFGATTVGGHLVAWLDDGRLAWLTARVDGFTVDFRDTGATAPLTAAVETSTGAVVVSGDNGFLARSTDRGHTFTRVASGTSLAIEDLTVIADGRLVAVGGRGTLLVSDDDGVTFTPVDSGVKQTLWSVVGFGSGVLIGGDDSLILRFAPASDDTWSDREDVFGGARVLDAAFAAGPDTFLDHGLVDYLEIFNATFTDDEPSGAARANDFEAVWGMPMPEECRRFFDVTAAAETWSTFKELRLDADLLADVADDENLFELVVLRDQQAYLGTGLAEIFSGAFHIGSQGNGDTYHLASHPGETDDGEPLQPQVLHYDHETHQFSDIFADRISSLVYLTALEKAREGRLISDEAHQTGLRALYGRVDPTWHFSIGDKDPDFEPLKQYPSLGEFFFFRSRWIQMLLKTDRVHGVTDAPSYFYDTLNPAFEPADLPNRVANCLVSVPTALYSMWRAFLFDEPELDEYLRACVTAPARLTRDSARLIDELRTGTRTSLGSITDITAWIGQIRDLDLDPRRAAQRDEEAVQASQRDAELAARYAADLADLDPADPSGLRELAERAWAHHDDRTYHAQVLAALRRDSAKAAVIARVIEVAAMDRSRESSAAALLAPDLDDAIDALLVGALLRGDEYDGAADPPTFHAHTGAQLLPARATLRLLDPRVAPAVRPLLAVDEQYNHRRRRCAIGLLGIVNDRESIPAISEIIIKTPMIDMLDSIGKEGLLIAASEALAAMPDPAAVDALATLITPQERFYDEVRGPAAAALAACLATVDDPRDVPDDVLDGLLFTIREANDADDNTHCTFGYGLIARELTLARRADALAKLAATTSARDDRVPALARAAAIRFAGGDSDEDLDAMLAEALTSPQWDHSYTVTRLDQVLRIAAEVPDLVDPGCVHWITRFSEFDLRDRAHRLLAQIGSPLEPAPVFDAARAQELRDPELIAAIGEEHLIGRAALITEAARRQLDAARTAVISVVHGVIRPAKPQEPLRHDRDALNAAVAYLVASELTDEVIACLDEILRHPSRDVRWDLLESAPKDPRLIAGMQHVASLNGGWQEEAALDWLSEVSA